MKQHLCCPHTSTPVSSSAPLLVTTNGAENKTEKGRGGGGGGSRHRRTVRIRGVKLGNKGLDVAGKGLLGDLHPKREVMRNWKLLLEIDLRPKKGFDRCGQ